MTTQVRFVTWTVTALLLIAAAPGAPQTSEDEALMQFQRAADSYAFQHRRVQRQAGDTPDQSAMALPMRMAKAVPAEGSLFTPVTAAAFRARIAAVVRRGCAQPRVASPVVPRAAEDAGGTRPLAACLVAALPRLPEELAYRSAGVALVLVDVHPNLVVDVLHAAFP